MARISTFTPSSFFDITIERDEGLASGRIIGAIKKGLAIRILRDAIDDIGDKIEEKAKELAPKDKDPDAYTWRERPGPTLKEHPVDRDINKRVHDPTHTVIRQEITVAKIPHYAIFVHEGTKPGYFAKNPGGFMKYRSFGKQYKRKFVHGQDPQPYLTEAFETVDREFVPVKVDIVRAKIRLVLGGGVITEVHAFGPGFLIRGAKGRFIGSI
jgi:hypothetical protein